MQDTENCDVNLSSPAFLAFIDRYGSYKLSVTVHYHIEYCISFPYVVYSDYANDERVVRIKKLMQVANIGRREAIEYCDLVERYLLGEGEEYRKQDNHRACDYKACSENVYVSDEKYKLLNQSLLALVESSDVSKRLRHCIAYVEEMEYIPIKTVADYIYAGQEAQNIILNIRNMGDKTIKELDDLIHKKLMKCDDYGMSQITPPHENAGLSLTDIHAKLPGWFRESLKEREYKILRFRAINKYTLGRIARSYNLTNERIRQIEAEAIRRIFRLYGRGLEIVFHKLDEELDKSYGDMPLDRASKILGMPNDLLKLLIYVYYKKRGRIRVKDDNVLRTE